MCTVTMGNRDLYIILRKKKSRWHLPAGYGIILGINEIFKTLIINHYFFMIKNTIFLILLSILLSLFITEIISYFFTVLDDLVKVDFSYH